MDALDLLDKARQGDPQAKKEIEEKYLEGRAATEENLDEWEKFLEKSYHIQDDKEQSLLKKINSNGRGSSGSQGPGNSDGPPGGNSQGPPGGNSQGPGPSDGPPSSAPTGTSNKTTGGLGSLLGWLGGILENLPDILNNLFFCSPTFPSGGLLCTFGDEVCNLFRTFGDEAGGKLIKKMQNTLLIFSRDSSSNICGFLALRSLASGKKK